MKQRECYAFRQLIREKKRFLIPVTVFFLAFYFMLPVSIICFPSVMNRPFLIGLTPAWAFAFAQFGMVWVLGALFYRRSKQFDRLVQQIQDKEQLE
ncbi:MAG TPA: DUF485 domain-containing protein [Bacillales bacterium]|nr:DUF485 domain-containing protein [Bacillales bacterium]